NPGAGPRPTGPLGRPRRHRDARPSARSAMAGDRGEPAGGGSRASDSRRPRAGRAGSGRTGAVMTGLVRTTDTAVSSSPQQFAGATARTATVAGGSHRVRGPLNSLFFSVLDGYLDRLLRPHKRLVF